METAVNLEAASVGTVGMRRGIQAKSVPSELSVNAAIDEWGTLSAITVYNKI